MLALCPPSKSPQCTQEGIWVHAHWHPLPSAGRWLLPDRTASYISFWVPLVLSTWWMTLNTLSFGGTESLVVDLFIFLVVVF